MMPPDIDGNRTQVYAIWLKVSSRSFVPGLYVRNMRRVHELAYMHQPSAPALQLVYLILSRSQFQEIMRIKHRGTLGIGFVLAEEE